MCAVQHTFTLIHTHMRIEDLHACHADDFVQEAGLAALEQVAPPKDAQIQMPGAHSRRTCKCGRATTVAACAISSRGRHALLELKMPTHFPSFLLPPFPKLMRCLRGFSFFPLQKARSRCDTRNWLAWTS